MILLDTRYHRTALKRSDKIIPGTTIRPYLVNTEADANFLGAEQWTWLEEQLKHFSPCDVVIVEGWKHHAMPKIEVHRKLSEKPLLFPEDCSVIAVASDESLATELPQFDLDDAEAVATFIIRYLGLRKAAIHVVKQC